MCVQDVSVSNDVEKARLVSASGVDDILTIPEKDARATTSFIGSRKKTPEVIQQ